MKRKLVVFLILVVCLSSYMFAQVQATVGVDVMTFGGIKITNSSSGETTTVEGPPELKLPFPYGQIAYNFDLGMVDIGLGAKAYTLILVSAIYPAAYVDVSLGPIVLHGGVGGGFFWVLAPNTSITKTGNVFLPEVGVYGKIGKVMQLGVTYISLLTDNTDFALPYVICISCRFVFDLFAP